MTDWPFTFNIEWAIPVHVTCMQDRTGHLIVRHPTQRHKWVEMVSPESFADDPPAWDEWQPLERLVPGLDLPLIEHEDPR